MFHFRLHFGIDFRTENACEFYRNVSWAAQMQGDHLGSKIPQNIKKILSTKIVHTSETFVENVRKIVKKMF